MFILALPVVLPFDLPRSLKAAIVSADVKEETVARAMGISFQQLNQQLNGHGHLSMGRVLMLALDPDTRVIAAKVLAKAILALRLERDTGVELVREEILTALASLPRRPVHAETRERAERKRA
jgi:hypothetical protein